MAKELVTAMKNDKGLVDRENSWQKKDVQDVPDLSFELMAWKLIVSAAEILGDIAARTVYLLLRKDEMIEIQEGQLNFQKYLAGDKQDWSYKHFEPFTARYNELVKTLTVRPRFLEIILSVDELTPEYRRARLRSLA